MTYYSRTGNRDLIKEKKRRRRQMQVNLELCLIGVCLTLFVFLIVDSTIGKQIFKKAIASALGQEIQESVTESFAQIVSTDKNNADTIREIKNAETKGLYFSKPKDYSASEIKSCLENMSGFSDEYKYVYEHMDIYPENLLRALCNNGEMLPFVLGYENGTYSAEAELYDYEKIDGIPLLMQWDDRWGYKKFGDDCMGLSGCGPTCMSMVAIGLTGNSKLTPDYIADYITQNGYYDDGAGTSWNFMTEGAAYLGITGTELVLSKENIINELESGHPIICSMKSGDFTTQGHYIVLTGVDNGKIIVNDPNCEARSSVLWEYSTIENQIKNLWVYTVA